METITLVTCKECLRTLTTQRQRFGFRMLSFFFVRFFDLMFGFFVQAIADGFAEWNKSEKVGKVDLAVTVLNESHWPIAGAEKFALSLSKPLSDCVTKFEEYYKSKTDKRKLRWLFNHGNVVLATHYGKGKVQVEVTPLQACILQLFEKERIITFENMIKLLWPDGQAAIKGGQSNADTLKFAIAPLVQTKGIAPIKRAGEGKEISENDKYQIRSEIKTKKRRLKFAGGSAAKTDSESKDVEKGVLKQVGQEKKSFFFFLREKITPARV